MTGEHVLQAPWRCKNDQLSSLQIPRETRRPLQYYPEQKPRSPHSVLKSQVFSLMKCFSGMHLKSFFGPIPQYSQHLPKRNNISRVCTLPLSVMWKLSAKKGKLQSKGMSILQKGTRNSESQSPGPLTLAHSTGLKTTVQISPLRLEPGLHPSQRFQSQDTRLRWNIFAVIFSPEA